MQKMWLFMSLLAVLGSHGIVIKCTAAIFSRTVDCEPSQLATRLLNDGP